MYKKFCFAETSTISSFTGSWANNSTSVDDESDHVIFNNKGFSSSEDLTDTDDHEIEGDDDVFSALENDANCKAINIDSKHILVIYFFNRCTSWNALLITSNQNFTNIIERSL